MSEWETLDAKGCGWCGHGAGHTTDEHVSRWGNPDYGPPWAEPPSLPAQPRRPKETEIDETD